MGKAERQSLQPRMIETMEIHIEKEKENGILSYAPKPTQNSNYP